MSALINPRIAGVRLSMLVHIYRLRLRAHAVQELLAASGIAIGVALVLGVLLVNTSSTSSAKQVAHQLSGSATLQLSARSSAGFPEALARSSRELPGVKAETAVLRQNVAVVSARGRVSLALLGVTPSALTLGGLAPRGISSKGFRFGGGLILPSAIAARLGVRPGEAVTVLARGNATRVPVGAVLGSSLLGPLASTAAAVGLLGTVQRLTGLPETITQVLLRTNGGQRAKVAAELGRLAGGRLDVAPAGHEASLLAEAVRPNDQSSDLFAAISVMIGFLLALNAMLLMVPERRRFVAEMRLQGYDWRQVIVLLALQAIVLGLLASAVGVLLAELLSGAFVHRTPAYLAGAFQIGGREQLGLGTVAIAVGCGVLASVLASLTPTLDLRPARAVDAVLRDRAGGSEVLPARLARRLALGGALALVAITLLTLLEPGLTILAGVALTLTMLSAIPLALQAVAGGLGRLGERARSSSLIVVVSELRAITTRAVALAAIAALAVYGSVAIGGARADLVRGLDAGFSEYLRTADLWVTAGGNDLATNGFHTPGAAAAIAATPGVRAVRSYQGGFLDVGPRRLWIIARPPQDRPLLPSSQIVSGRAGVAEALIRAGGWASVSSVFAAEHHLRLSAGFNLPTPSGAARLRVAAITTNLGWAAGAVVMNASDYRRHWPQEDPTALEVDLNPGVSASAARSELQRALRPWPGLSVQTVTERRAHYSSDARQGVHQLGEISTLLLLAAALAVAAALSAALWQRRTRLAALKIQGYATAQLWRALLLEAGVVLGVGCVIGAATGIFGHALASRWLRLRTGFPAPFELGLGRVLLTLTLLALTGLVVVSLPGRLAAGAPARAGLQE